MTTNSTRPSLSDRELLTLDEANSLQDLFKILGNTTRLRILHCLTRAKELCVLELCEAISMKPQAVSNQLQSLTECGILRSRRLSTNIFYRIEDPCVLALLEHGLCLVEETESLAKARGR